MLCDGGGGGGGSGIISCVMSQVLNYMQRKCLTFIIICEGKSYKKLAGMSENYRGTLEEMKQEDDMPS